VSPPPLDSAPHHQKGLVRSIKVRLALPTPRCGLHPRVQVASDRDAPRILLCEKTREFRRLARAQLTKDDFCVELGCSWGEASHLLAQRCSRLIGLDNSHKAIAACRQKYPEARVRILDDEPGLRVRRKRNVVGSLMSPRDDK